MDNIIMDNLKLSQQVICSAEYTQVMKALGKHINYLHNPKIKDAVYSALDRAWFAMNPTRSCRLRTAGTGEFAPPIRMFGSNNLAPAEYFILINKMPIITMTFGCVGYTYTQTALDNMDDLQTQQLFSYMRSRDLNWLDDTRDIFDSRLIAYCKKQLANDPNFLDEYCDKEART